VSALEPRQRDWAGRADFAKIPEIEPRVPALLALARTRFAERELIVVDERRTTYGALEAASAVLARHLLAAGIAKGGRVGVLLPSDETFLIAWFAIARIGAVGVTLSTLSTPAEIRHIARHADLELLIAPERWLHHDYVARIAAAFPSLAARAEPQHLPEAPFLRRIWIFGERAPAWAQRIALEAEPGVDGALLAAAEAEVAPSDPAGIIYTSGSTADPKGIVHSHGGFLRQAEKLAATYDYQSDERFYAAMPFFWVGGLTVSVLCLMRLGGTLLASGRSGPALLDFLERERTTSVLAWPHTLRALAADPSFASRDWSAMRGGLLYEALPPDRRPKDPTLMGMALGMTETNGPYTIQQRNLPEERRGSVGPLMPGIEGRLVDPDTREILATWTGGDPRADSGGRIGIIQVRSDVMMLGMVKRERREVFDADGWYDTGDLCSFRDGFLYFHGRADDLIKASGANVSPREVESVLLQIPGVASANVSGVADRVRGQVVGAVLVPRPGAALDPELVRKEAARLLSPYKVPRVIVILAATQVPMMSSTKVDRRALIRLLEEAHAR
jgi:acyl-CoA synthetase (AMP-forming)/AMP-acid ligase II